MTAAQEVEIKFVVPDLDVLKVKLRAIGFHEKTPRTHEMNTLFDTPGHDLRRRGELLRVRKYGDTWLLTHKSRSSNERHKTRRELETKIADGEKLDAILRVLGYSPTFRYEKFRAEWTDGNGHVVLDETPIGNLAEIEGAPEWIDQVAAKLGVSDQQYVTKNYATLFFEWKAKTRSSAHEMTFEAVRAK